MPSPHPSLPIPAQKEERFEWLMKFLRHKTLEDTNLDYKSGDALNSLDGPNSDKFRKELIKDVSAFANAAGGLLIYGISEDKPAGQAQAVPARIMPVMKERISTDRLSQILNGIMPPLKDYDIQLIELPEEEHPGGCCVAIEVPQSPTAHQAKDGKYYRRTFNGTAFMEDYEVRDVMNRAKHPDLDSKIELIFRPVIDPNKPYSNSLVVRLLNSSEVFCKNFCCRVTLPINIQGKFIGLENPTRTGLTEKGVGAQLDFQGTDIFPGFDRRCDFPFGFIVAEPAAGNGKAAGILEDNILVEIFADSMPKKRFWISVEEALMEHKESVNALRRAIVGQKSQMPWPCSEQTTATYNS